MNPWTRFKVAAVLAFASVISFFQVNSAYADKHHINWFWIMIGIVFAGFFADELIIVAKTSNNGNSNMVGTSNPNSGYSGYSRTPKP